MSKRFAVGVTTLTEPCSFKTRGVLSEFLT
jgi:hypothetical protein